MCILDTFLAFTGNYPNGRINIMLLLLLCLVGISLIAFKGKLQINSLYTIPLLYFLYFLSDVSNGISSSSDIVNLVICIALIVTFVQYIFNKSDTYTVIRSFFFFFDCGSDYWYLSNGYRRLLFFQKQKHRFTIIIRFSILSKAMKIIVH